MQITLVKLEHPKIIFVKVESSIEISENIDPGAKTLLIYWNYFIGIPRNNQPDDILST